MDKDCLVWIKITSYIDKICSFNSILQFMLILRIKNEKNIAHTRNHIEKWKLRGSQRTDRL